MARGLSVGAADQRRKRAHLIEQARLDEVARWGVRVVESGHGWVRPRADGSHDQCGGPAVCEGCKAEKADLDARGVEVVWAVRLAPGMVIEDGRTICWVNGREVGFSDGNTERGVTWLPVRRDEPHGSRPDRPGKEAEAALDGVRDQYAIWAAANDRAWDEWARTVEKMIEARNTGVSMARIGQEVGLTRERVRQIINEWGQQLNGGAR